MYYSHDLHRFCQLTPKKTVPSLFAPQGWTLSLESYMREANKLSRCIIDNAKKQHYSHVIHLNHNDVLPVSQLKDIWTKATRKLRLQGIDLLYVREFNNRAKCHYHIIVSGWHSQDAVKRAFEKAMPDRKQVRWRMRVEVFDPAKLVACAYYVTKGCPRGWKDVNKRKRLLFNAGLGLKKYGVVGEFWATSKAALWDEVKGKEADIQAGLNQPGVWEYCERMAKATGQDINKVKRIIGLEVFTENKLPSETDWLSADDWLVRMKEARHSPHD